MKNIFLPFHHRHRRRCRRWKLKYFPRRCPLCSNEKWISIFACFPKWITKIFVEISENDVNEHSYQGKAFSERRFFFTFIFSASLVEIGVLHIAFCVSASSSHISNISPQLSLTNYFIVFRFFDVVLYVSLFRSLKNSLLLTLLLFHNSKTHRTPPT